LFLSTPCNSWSLLRHTRWFWSFFVVIYPDGNRTRVAGMEIQLLTTLTLNFTTWNLTNLIVVLSLKVVNVVIYLVPQLDADLYFTCAQFASPAFLEYKRWWNVLSCLVAMNDNKNTKVFYLHLWTFGLT